MNNSYTKVIGGLCVVASLFSCTQTENTSTYSNDVGTNHVADLQVVDCLLPGQVRRLGNSSYMTSRRPIRTTAADCQIRGGEYVAFDRSDYKTALKIWLPSAKAGDVEAQANVGEIFERGLGGEPNYEAAIIWYKKAAKAGNSRAQFNLGTLYEQGLGVEKNKLLALNWYRQAWGLPADDLIYQSAAAEEQQALRNELLQQSRKKDRQITLLLKQLESLQQGRENDKKIDDMSTEISELKDWIDRLKKEKALAKNQADAIPKFREPETLVASVKSDMQQANGRSVGEIEFGKYYALVIGNEHYVNLDDLGSPLNDTSELAELLRDKYGFSVQLLSDADNLGIMQAVNNLNSVLGEKDNLLIFYAGHGSRVQSPNYESGYWLPVNANLPPNDSNWVSSEFITRHLARIKAKRVLVVADSCYSGLLSSAPNHLFFSGNDSVNSNQSAKYLRYKLAKRSRLLLSSGGDKPVLDNAGSGHSVFARAFLDVLNSNDNIISAPEVFSALRDTVNSQAEKVGVEQTPEFKAIKGAGHEVGDFFFVPNVLL